MGLSWWNFNFLPWKKIRDRNIPQKIGVSNFKVRHSEDEEYLP
jgi:hypothetical protein